MEEVQEAQGVLEMPEPIGLQPLWLDSPASRKVLRVGRRGSKTRFAFFAAIMGHGPGWEDDAPKFKGVLQGLDVVWLAQTYGNLATVLWREEIVPRMGHLPWVELKVQTHDVNVLGRGSLMLRSADREAIDAIRGIGKKLGGVIIDEAAWLDLRGALQDVILLALADNGGWLILMSTTNAGGDGGYDDAGAPQIPSYFNVLCEEIRAGTRSSDWAEFVGTAFDNPEMDPKAINELIAEYPEGSPKLDQEVYAKLLQAGVGLALPKLNKARHVTPRFTPEPGWHQWGAFDWGFNHPWVFGWYCVDPDGNVFAVDTIRGRGDTPEAIGAAVLEAGVPLDRPSFVIHAGHDIWQNKGRASGFTGPTIAERLSGFGWKLVRASIGRVLGLDNLRLYTDYAEDWPVDRHPRFQWMDTAGNLLSLAGCQRMQIDPKDMEDALGIDADAAARGGDDDYDCVRYGLMARPLTRIPTREAVKVQDRALPVSFKGGRVARRKTPQEELDAEIQRESGAGNVIESIPRW